MGRYNLNYLLSNQDQEIWAEEISPSDIQESLTMEDVETFIKSLGVTSIKRQGNSFIIPTICHNPIDDETASMKLYYYHKDKNFWCYTGDCGRMTIFQLYQRFMEVNCHPISFQEAVDYVKSCLKKKEYKKAAEANQASPLVINKENYSFEKVIIKLDEFNSSVLDCFLNYHHSTWLKEGISDETMNKFHIGYCLSQNKITIPQFDVKGRLVGIRARALEPIEVMTGYKYMPITIGGVLYRHSTSMTLYGLYEHQKAIKKYKRVIIFEAEKSCLLHDTYYGEDSVAVALCGSNMNKYQVNLLTKILGVSEIVIALDNELTQKDWRKKIVKWCKKYAPYAQMSYVFDEHHLLRDKDSPIDRGKEIWEKLFNKRIKVDKI